MRARRRTVAILGLAVLLAMTALVVLIPSRGRRRGFLAMAPSPACGKNSLVRVAAPHLGPIGEFLLEKDCGGCHAGTAALPAPAALPPSPCATGLRAGSTNCRKCHAGTGQQS